jgi:rhomboid protease GluP
MSDQPRICSDCGALVTAGSRECPYCGARAPSATADALRRMFGFILPRWCPVTNLLIVASVANMLVVLLLYGGQELLRPSPQMLTAMGALNPYLFHKGEGWRLITYAYLHIGLLHIAFNMITLSQVGTAIEETIGGSRLFVVYSLSLIGGGVADLLVRGTALMNIAGASGALFGLIGFGVSFAHFYGGELGRSQRNFFLHWAVYGFAFGYLVNADNICHLGGFIAGALLGYPIDWERGRRDRFTPYWRVLAVALLAVTLAAFVWMVMAGRPR